MSRHQSDRTFKPALETLERRELPATGLGVSLFAGTLVSNLSALNSSETNAANQFKTDQSALAALSSGVTSAASIQSQYAKAQTDYQAVLDYQSAIQRTEAADVSFLGAASLFSSGSSTDFFLYLFFVQPQLQTQLTNANNTASGVSSQANTVYNTGNFTVFFPPNGLASIASNTHNF
jgi:hypothetical protein